jgi:tetratricopeptide (TPR) repeat protein
MTKTNHSEGATSRQLAAVLIAASTATLLSLALVELGLRLWSQHTPAPPTASADIEPGLMEQVPLTFSWAPRRNYTSRRTAPDGKAFSLRTNSHRMRGAEIADEPPLEHRRILFLGDSFTMASSHRENETFVGHVQRILQQQSPRAVEVINAGVDGYGTYNELAYYQQHARKLQPHIVVLCLYTGNDFRDNMVATSFGSNVNPHLFSHPRKFAHRDASPRRLLGPDGAWLPDPISGDPVVRPDHRWNETLQQRSLLARLVGSRFHRLLGQWRGDLSVIDIASLYHYYEIGFFQQRDETPFRIALDLTTDAIDELRRATEEAGAELLVVVLPSDLQLVDERYYETLANLGIDEASLGPVDRWHVNHRLGAFTTGRQIRQLDLAGDFASAPRPDLLYQSHDSKDRHLSAEGHRLAGEAIGTFLLEESSHLADLAVDVHERSLGAIAAGNLNSAEQGLREAITLNPSWMGTYRSLGNLLRQQLRYGEARDIYLAALEYEPDAVDLHQASGDMSLALGDSADALAAYRAAVDLRPSDLVARERQYHLQPERAGEPHQLRVVAELPKPSHEAHLYYREMYAREFYDAGILAGNVELSLCYFRISAREYGFLLKQRPDDPTLLESLANSYYNLAEVLIDLQQPGAAADYYERSGELNPNGVTYFKLGNTLTSSGNLASAVGAYRTACRLEPGVHDVHYNLAVALALLGNELKQVGEHETARAHWREAHNVLSDLVRRAPSHRQAPATLARVEQLLKRE